MKSKPILQHCDTLIIGSSMAGACLARQLKLKHPDMDIVVIDRKKKFDYWVGESTLESFWDYAVKYLDLGYYLDTNHIYKHGLRFFYDSPQHDLAIDEMSEVGRSWYHTTPAHQIDRKRFDADLYKMNVATGINVRLGVAVKNITLDSEQGHIVTTSDGRYQCRWLIDAAGLSSPIGQQLGLVKSNNDNHPINSYWGRFKNITNLDLLGNFDWRARVNHTTRTLATTHFMYGGYWIWLIPIDRETFSIGLTNRTDMVDISIANQDEFIDFLKSHKCMRQLLNENSQIADFHKLKGISRQAKQSFSDQRWFLTGMAAAILDPMLSPGSALLADNNRMIGDLIATDLAGDTQVYKNKVKAYNAYSKFWLENFFLHIKGHYHDCYDRQRANFETLLMQWFGIVLPTSMAEHWWYDPTMPEEQFDMLETQGMQMLADSSIHKIDTVVEEFHQYLIDHNAQYTNNRGQFYDIEIDNCFMHNTRTFGKHLSPEAIQEIELKMLQVAVKQSLMRMAEIAGIQYQDSMLDTVVDSVIKQALTLKQGLKLFAEDREAETDVSNMRKETIAAA